jgi:hypothetical protein
MIVRTRMICLVLNTNNTNGLFFPWKNTNQTRAKYKSLRAKHRSAPNQRHKFPHWLHEHQTNHDRPKRCSNLPDGWQRSSISVSSIGVSRTQRGMSPSIATLRLANRWRIQTALARDIIILHNNVASTPKMSIVSKFSNEVRGPTAQEIERAATNCSAIRCCTQRGAVVNWG